MQCLVIHTLTLFLQLSMELLWCCKNVFCRTWHLHSTPLNKWIDDGLACCERLDFKDASAELTFVLGSFVVFYFRYFISFLPIWLTLFNFIRMLREMNFPFFNISLWILQWAFLFHYENSKRQFTRFTGAPFSAIRITFLFKCKCWNHQFKDKSITYCRQC